MLLSQKVAALLALTRLIRDSKVRASLTEQADAVLALMVEGSWELASGFADVAAMEAMTAAEAEGWTEGALLLAVEREMRRANIVPPPTATPH